MVSLFVRSGQQMLIFRGIITKLKYQAGQMQGKIAKENKKPNTARLESEETKKRENYSNTPVNIALLPQRLYQYDV